MGRCSESVVFWHIVAGVVWMTCVYRMPSSVSKAAEDPNGVLSNPAGSLDVVLESVEVSAKVCADDGGEAMLWTAPVRTLRISLGFVMVDANKPIAIDLNPPVVLGLWDAAGQAVDIQSASSAGERSYEEVRWTLTTEDGRSVTRLVPDGVTVDLVLDPNQAFPASLSQIDGYVYALYAEKVIETDVPFEVSGEWIETTEDLQISVCPQTPPTPGPIQYEAILGATGRSNGLRPTAPVALWKYETCVHSTAGDSVLPLFLPWERTVSVGDYVVIKTQLVESNTWCREVSKPWAYLDFSGDCFCSGQVEQDHRDYDHIRHVIAVHPVEVKVPFTLTDIPIPASQ